MVRVIMLPQSPPWVTVVGGELAGAGTQVREGPLGPGGLECWEMVVRTLIGVGWSVPYSSYPSLSMSLWHVSANCFNPNPFFLTPPENPKFGSDGATTWKAGKSLLPAVRRGRIFDTSSKLPGPSNQTSAL